MKTYYFKNSSGSTEINLSRTFDSLGWIQSNKQAQFTHENLISDQLLEIFEQKHKLHYWLMKHCLEVSPKTVVLDELFLHQTLDKLISNQCNNKPWILKPALLNNGQGIKIFSELINVREYFRQNHRYSGLFVLQEYINNPKLINNRKFSIRMFVVLSSDGQIFLYQHGYLNICNSEYNKSDFILESHLTNEHLNTDGSKNNQQLTTEYWHDFNEIFPLISSQCKKIFTPFFNDIHFKTKGYAILGVDFMTDENNNLFLLEINHGACFPVNNQHHLFDSLYTPLWSFLVSEIIEKNSSSGRFIKLN